jgi:hypothetical protein
MANPKNWKGQILNNLSQSSQPKTPREAQPTKSRESTSAGTENKELSSNHEGHIKAVPYDEDNKKCTLSKCRAEICERDRRRDSSGRNVDSVLDTICIGSRIIPKLLRNNGVTEQKNLCRKIIGCDSTGLELDVYGDAEIIGPSEWDSKKIGGDIKLKDLNVKEICDHNRSQNIDRICTNFPTLSKCADTRSGLIDCENKKVNLTKFGDDLVFDLPKAPKEYYSPVNK